jgi:hypothetical protein
MIHNLLSLLLLFFKINTGDGEGQAQQCGEVKLVSDILWK